MKAYTTCSHPLLGFLLTFLRLLPTIHGQDVKCGASGRCYRYQTAGRDYVDAQSTCQSYGGTLVSVTTPVYQEEMETILGEYGADITLINAKRTEDM